MDKPVGQSDRTTGLSTSRTASTATRDRLMDAAAELIAERGWGGVTTRAVAERAGLPHGAVSYHFRGKRELLIEAALHAFTKSLPAEEFEALGSVDDIVSIIAAEVGDRDAIDPVTSRLMLESMREAERDDLLRERMGALMAGYRRFMVEAVAADQQRGVVYGGASPDAIATLVAATGDGLLLHALLDPDLDIAGAIEALRSLLHQNARPVRTPVKRTGKGRSGGSAGA